MNYILIILIFICISSLCEGRVRSNTGRLYPKDSVLADLDGDGLDEKVLWHKEYLFVANGDHLSKGLAVMRLSHDVNFVFTGYFQHEKSSSQKEDVCIVYNRKHNYKCCNLECKNSTQENCVGGKYEFQCFFDSTQHGLGDSTLFGRHHVVLTGNVHGDKRDEVIIYDERNGKIDIRSFNHERITFIKLASNDNVKPFNDKRLRRYDIRIANIDNSHPHDDIILYKSNKFNIWKLASDKVLTETAIVNFDIQRRHSFQFASIESADSEELVVFKENGDGHIDLYTYDTVGKSFQTNGTSSQLLSHQVANFRNHKLYFGNFNGGSVGDDPVVHKTRGSQILIVFTKSIDGFEFVHANPPLDLTKDSDGDGLLNFFELGGQLDVPLHEYGASPFYKDIFLEIDYMAPRASDGAVFAMMNITISGMVRALGRHSINLHVFQEHDNPQQVIPYQRSLGVSTDNFDLERTWRRLYDPLKRQYFTKNRRGLFRYCISLDIIENDGSTTGIARNFGGTDFIMSLGDMKTLTGIRKYRDELGTILHEMGHTLGLKHGGTDHINRKPNYLSIMNYDLTNIGIGVLNPGAANITNSTRHFDYSTFKCDDINERRFNENNGIVCPGQTTRFLTKVFGLNTMSEINVPLDINNDGVVANNVNFDINGESGTRLKGVGNEYDILKFKAGDLGRARTIRNANQDISGASSFIEEGTEVEGPMGVREPHIHVEDLQNDLVGRLDEPLPEVFWQLVNPKHALLKKNEIIGDSFLFNTKFYDSIKDVIDVFSLDKEAGEPDSSAEMDRLEKTVADAHDWLAEALETVKKTNNLDQKIHTESESGEGDAIAEADGHIAKEDDHIIQEDDHTIQEDDHITREDEASVEDTFIEDTKQNSALLRLNKKLKKRL